MSRIEVILKNPNPLFEKWLEEWLEEAKIQNSNTVATLSRALNSLRRFPLPLDSGRECTILRGFGPTLCSLLDQKLEEHKRCVVKEADSTYSKDIADVTKKVRDNLNKKTTKKLSPTKRNQKTNSKYIGEAAQSDANQIIMNEGEYQIVLIVDTQETNGKNKTTMDETQFHLEKQKIQFEVRRLSIGDFAWVCRNKKNEELILPYIVERKRMDDFANSIRDGRFHEQKFRLTNSGIEKIFYLIESYGSNQHVGLPITNLMQAATNTQVHSGFQIKFTDNQKESIGFLAMFTRILIDRFRNKTLISTPKTVLRPLSTDSALIGLMEFNVFQESSCKTKFLQVRDIFIKQLLQLKSLSIDKALAITAKYPTPKHLLAEYSKCIDDEGETLLAHIPSGKLCRPVGLPISKIIYNYFNKDLF